MTNTIVVALLVVMAMYLTYRLVSVAMASRRSSKAPKQPEKKRPGTGELVRVFDDNEEDPEVTKLRLPRLIDQSDLDESEPPPSTPEDQVPIPIVYDSEADVDQATQESAQFLLSAVGQSERGRRPRNEDAYLVLDDPPLFAIADGMGGYRGGDVASHKTVEVLEEHMAVQPKKEDEEGIPYRAAHLLRAVYRANANVYDHAREAPELEGMGTTLVAARFSPRKERVYIAHVGDSRCYVYRGGELKQMTTDHTVGSLHEVDAPVASHLMRALGVRSQVEVDLILGKPRPGDRYLLCSDGLSQALAADEITAYLDRPDAPSKVARALVEAAEVAGGKDNITVIVVDVEPAQSKRAAMVNGANGGSHDGGGGPSAA